MSAKKSNKKTREKRESYFRNSAKIGSNESQKRLTKYHKNTRRTLVFHRIFFHQKIPSFMPGNLESALGAERRENYLLYFLPLEASRVTSAVSSPRTVTSSSAERPLLHSARTTWSPASRLVMVRAAPSVLSALSPST